MTGPPAPWGTLPTELLVAILGHLTLEERQRGPVAVCKAWHAACYTPSLLRHLHLRGGRYAAQHYSLDKLASMGHWLCRHRPAQHATSITFSLVLPTGGPVMMDAFAQAAAEQAAQLQAAQLQPAQAAQQQQQQQQAEEGEVNQPMPPLLHPQQLPLAVQLGLAGAQQLGMAGGHPQFGAFHWGAGAGAAPGAGTGVGVAAGPAAGDSDGEDDGDESGSDDASEQDDSAVEDPHEGDVLATCLAAVAASATPALTSMQLSIECITLTTSGWPGGLTSLTRLGFTNHDGGVRMSPQMRELRSLRELSIVADRVSGQENLPLSMTRLTWAEASLVMYLPRQLTAVRNLRHFEVGCPNFDAEALNVLTQLTSMRHLALNNTVLPTAMAHITWLRSLRILDSSRCRSADLPAALPALQQLTALALGYVRLWRPRLIAALNQLPRLQRLVVCYVPDDAASSSRMDWPGPADLPAPAFLGRLTWLGLDADLLVRNPHLLAAASQLQHLWLMGRCGCSPRHKHAWQQLLEVAAQLPRLQCISLRPSRGSRAYAYRPLEPHQREDLEALQRQRPGLVVDESKFQPVTNNVDLWMPFFSD